MTLIEDPVTEPAARTSRPTPAPAPPSTSRWPSWPYWVRTTAAVALTLVVIGALRSVASVFVLVVIAVVLAVGLDPLVERLERRGMRRGWAVAVIVVGALAAVVGFAFAVAPPLVHQLTGLSDDIPRYAARLEGRDDWIGTSMRQNDVTGHVRDFLQRLPQTVGRSFGTILGFAGRVGALVFATITVAILTVYFMVSLPSMRRTVTIVFHPPDRWQVDRVIDGSIERIGGYVTGNAITSLCCAAASLVALVTMGVPFAIPLALWAGFADLIPAVGAYLGAAPAILVAFFVSPTVGILATVFFLAYQQFENYVLVPRVMKNAVNLSPAAVIVATLIGASWAGFAGALLALPVAATLKVVIVEIWLKERAQKGDGLAIERLEEEGAEAG